MAGYLDGLLIGKAYTRRLKNFGKVKCYLLNSRMPAVKAARNIRVQIR